MKEKTFEELIEEELSTIDDFDDVPVLMLNLLQQVREATIAECAETAREHWTSPEFNIKQLPTDRIKTDK